VWGNFLWLSSLEMLRIISLGHLQVSMALIPIGIKGFFGMKLLICSFTVARFPSERSGEACLFQAMMEFFDFSLDHGLMDLPLVGGTFTWSNNRESPSCCRIDRFSVSLEWEAQFPSMS